MPSSDVITLSDIAWSNRCTFDVLYDKNRNALLRVLADGDAVVALYFTDISPQALTSLRTRWARAYCPSHRANQIGPHEKMLWRSAGWHDVVPVRKIDTLPDTVTCQQPTLWKETAIWADPNLRFCITPGNCEGSYISLLTAGGCEVGHFRFPCHGPDDDYVIGNALHLRNELGLKRQIRVESTQFAPKKTSYYVPALARD